MGRSRSGPFEAGRWRAIETWTALLGLDPENLALRMMMRSSIGALDEATVYWLQNNEPFEVEGHGRLAGCGGWRVASAAG
ncbi:hypothetical protein ACIHAX_30195 [Nocardia sp. NPDC051929]|uniref:hypothetical protein n=1 Tax=unclassified Nocardia TaxID=2637762 RepID=UPI00344109B2